MKLDPFNSRVIRRVTSRIIDDSDTIRRLAYGVIALFATLVCVGFFFPAYVDDILWILLNSRAGYDGWQSARMLPECGANFSIPIPFALLPGRAMAWMMHSLADDFYTLRLFTTLLLLAWIAYTTWFIRKCFMPLQPVVFILAGILSFVGLGLLPFILLMGRPETAMIFAVTFFASFPYLIKEYPALPLLGRACAIVLFVMVMSWLLAIHPKGLFFAPLLLVSAGSVCRWNKTAGCLLMGAVAWTSYQAWLDFNFSIACPDSAKLAHTMEYDNTILPSVLLHNPSRFLHQLLFNIFNSVTYLWHINLVVGGYWLPDVTSVDAGPVYLATKDGITMPYMTWCLLWMAMLILTAKVLLHALSWIARGAHFALRDPSARDAIRRQDLLVPLSLLAAFIAQTVGISKKEFYNFSLLWITLGLAGATLGMYLLKYTAFWKRETKEARRSYGSLVLISFINQCTLLLTYIPVMLSLIHAETSNGRIEDREFAISEQHYHETKTHILDAARMCHIAPDRASHRLVIDKYTYWPLKATYQPLRVAFIYREFDDPRNLFPFLRAQDSAGILTLCSTLPKKIRPLALEHEGVCCLSHDQIMAPQDAQP